MRVGRSPSQRLCYRLPLCGLHLKRSVAWSWQWPRALVKSGSCWGKGYNRMGVGDVSGQCLGNKWLQLCLLRGKHPPACNGVLEQLEREQEPLRSPFVRLFREEQGDMWRETETGDNGEQASAHTSADKAPASVLHCLQRRSRDQQGNSPPREAWRANFTKMLRDRKYLLTCPLQTLQDNSVTSLLISERH